LIALVWRCVLTWHWTIAASAVALLLGLAACGPAGGQSPAAAPPVKAPAETSKPAAQPAKPAAEPAKPAAEKPAAATKPAGPQRQLRYVTTSSGSSVFAYAVAHGKVINSKVPEVNVTVVESGSTIENVTRMARGEAEMGIATTDVLYRALNGLDQWKDKPITNLRWVWTHSMLPLLFLVREDSGVQKLADLEGKDFNPGIRGSATENVARQALEALGVKPKWYVGDTNEAVTAIKDRRIVGFVKASAGPRSADAAILELMTSVKLRHLSFSDEQFTKVLEKYPWHGIGTLEANVYKADWNTQPLRLWTLVAGIATTTDLPEDLVYKIAKAIHEDNQPGGEGIQAAAFGSIKGIDIAKQTLDGLRVPLHAGAERYYRELGLAIPAEARSPEARR
jgi:TRAP transporter TAXI family solute receptor